MLSRIARPARSERSRTPAYAAFLHCVGDGFNEGGFFVATCLFLRLESEQNHDAAFVLVGGVRVTVGQGVVEQQILVVLKRDVIVTLFTESNNCAQFTVRGEKLLFVHLLHVFVERLRQLQVGIAVPLRMEVLRLGVLLEHSPLHLKDVLTESSFVDV